MIKREKKRANPKKPETTGNPFQCKDIRQIVAGSFLLLFVIIAACMAVMIKDYVIRLREQSFPVNDQQPGCMEVTGYPTSGMQTSLYCSDSMESGQSSPEKSISSSETETKSDGDSGNESKDVDSFVYIPLAVEPSKSKETIDSTISFITQKIPYLQQAMQSSSYYYSEKILDENTGTTAYMLAKNENYAQNLNAYFYYLFDTKPSTAVISPFVLNIATLFEQDNREAVVEDGTFAEPGYLDALKQSMIAVLGSYYNEEIFNFVYSEYVRTFVERLNGDPLQTTVYKLQSDHIEVFFHNSFLTYVEFYIDS